MAGGNERHWRLEKVACEIAVSGKRQLLQGEAEEKKAFLRLEVHSVIWVLSGEKKSKYALTNNRVGPYRCLLVRGKIFSRR